MIQYGATYLYIKANGQPKFVRKTWPTRRHSTSAKKCNILESSAKTKFPDCVKYYFESTRKQIEHEDNLVNQRCTRLLQVDIFLFSGFAATLVAQDHLDDKPVIVLVVLSRLIFFICGFVISLATIRSLNAAYNSAANLENDWHQFIERHQAYLSCFPQIAGIDKIRGHAKNVGKSHFFDRVRHFFAKQKLSSLLRKLARCMIETVNGKSDAIIGTDGNIQTTVIAGWSAIFWLVLLIGSLAYR